VNARTFAGLFLATAAALTVPAFVGAAGSVPAAPTAGIVAPLRAVVLVDESGSLSAADLGSEQQAAASLGLAELSPASRFQVVGFGSWGRGTTPIDQVCGPGFVTLSDRSARDRYATCAAKLHSRTVSQGNDTDFYAALSYAVQSITATPLNGQVPVIFLLTDGVLDVSHTTLYGSSAQVRNAEATRRIEQEVLPAARKAGIQIWPLGFGRADAASLDRFAAGGAGANSHCSGVPGAPVSRPRSHVVGASAQVVQNLLETLLRARCGDLSAPAPATLQPGKTVSLHVTIPPIASDGAIAVVKGDPAFVVSYFDPKGNRVPAAGALNGQRFERSGADASVEALRIENPLPGSWRVEVSDPQGRPGQLVVARALWQGALDSSVVLDPLQPKPGDKVAVEVRLLRRSGPVPKGALAGLQAGMLVSGNFGQLKPIRLQDDASGAFRGSFAVPAEAKGALQVRTLLSGAGVASNLHTITFPLAGPAPLSADFGNFKLGSLHPGVKVSGTLTVTNSGQPRQVEFALADVAPANAQLTIATPSAPLMLPSGRQRVPFKLAVPNSAPDGPFAATLVVREIGGAPLAAHYVSGRVTRPPSTLSQYWWLIVVVVLIALTAVAAVLLRRRAHSATADTYGLVASLEQADEPLGRPLPAPGGPEFRFELLQSDGETAKLLQAGSGRGTQVLVRRAGNNVELTVGGAEPQISRLGESLEVGDGLVLRVNNAEGVRRSGVSTDSTDRAAERDDGRAAVVKDVDGGGGDGDW